MRRLVRMTGESFVQRPNEITRFDVAKWFDVELRLVRMHSNGLRQINDFWQMSYSQFFHLMDTGCLKVTFEGRRKVLVRVKAPDTPPKKKLRPYVDLGTMRLGFDT